MSMPQGESEVDFSFLRRIVRANSHNVLDPARDYVFAARLGPVIRAAGMASLSQLVEHLHRKRDPHLECAVADAMTINETSFFRDGRPFELLRMEILPRVIAARPKGRMLRMWSAACSTGQEPYSLAMLVREHFPSLSHSQVQIEATDYSRDVLSRAEAGRYEQIEVNRGLPVRLLTRYFDQDGEAWVVKPELRSLCRFKWANLVNAPLPVRGLFDVILLRNVLLYFAPQERRSVLAQVHGMLAQDGVLILGSSEQPVDAERWTPVLSGGTMYFCRR